mmetsp:Transcript_151/g.189  ORF Transcript_151/g.189 Transcript_151/m.189 type:complete len:201 (-) Transcript_151:702-1304(-)
MNQPNDSLLALRSSEEGEATTAISGAGPCGTGALSRVRPVAVIAWVLLSQEESLTADGRLGNASIATSTSFTTFLFLVFAGGEIDAIAEIDNSPVELVSRQSNWKARESCFLFVFLLVFWTVKTELLLSFFSGISISSILLGDKGFVIVDSDSKGVFWLCCCCCRANRFIHEARLRYKDDRRFIRLFFKGLGLSDESDIT